MHTSWRISTLALTAACAVAAAAHAQNEADAGHWEFGDSRGGFCIWYLADPVLAAKLVDGNTQLAPAGQGEGLPPAVARVIQDEPRFAQWIPATVCLGFFGTVTVGTDVIARAENDKPVIVATSALAASSPRGVAGAGWYLLDLLTNHRSVRSSAGDAGFAAGGLDYLVRPSDSNEDESLEFDFSGVNVFWIGHAYGERSVGTTQAMSFGYAGGRKTNWKLTISASPKESQPVVGALRVEGKNDLAKALKSSPIRIVTPRDYGGGATLSFQKETHQ
jgi:hypothetical protein